MEAESQQSSAAEEARCTGPESVGSKKRRKRGAASALQGQKKKGKAHAKKKTSEAPKGSESEDLFQTSDSDVTASKQGNEANIAGCSHEPSDTTSSTSVSTVSSKPRSKKRPKLLSYRKGSWKLKHSDDSSKAQLPISSGMNIDSISTISHHSDSVDSSCIEVGDLQLEKRDGEPTGYSEMQDSNMMTSKETCGKETCSCAEVSPQTEVDPGQFLQVGSQELVDISPIQSQVVSQDVAAIIETNMKLLLGEEWVINHTTSFIRFCVLSDGHNPIVLKCLVWENQAARIYAKNYFVPKDKSGHYFNIMPPDVQNIGSICDYLSALAQCMLTMQICGGVQAYRELWDINKGHIEFTPKYCFRSLQCEILIQDSICKACQQEFKSMEKSMEKKEKQALTAKDRTKVPNIYMNKEELIEKAAYLQRERRKEQKKVQRLQEKVNKLMKQSLLSVDEKLSNDLTNIMNDNHEKMSDMKKIFWNSQKNALKVKDSRGLRWHPMMIRVALHLRFLSQSAYSYLKDCGFISLPSERRLYDFSKAIEPKEGCHEDIMRGLESKINATVHEHQQYVNLMFDEMHIRSDIVTTKSGEIIGFTNLSEVEKELQMLEAEMSNKSSEPKLAKKILVFMIQGITSDILDVVAVHSTDDLSASQLYSRTWDVIYNLEEVGAKVLCVTCDGAAVNRKFIRMHAPWDTSVNFIYATTNLASGEARPLFFILDPPHLMKTIRNCVANSNGHKRTRNLWKNGENISWAVFVLLLNLTRNDPYRDHKLTDAHVKLTSFSAMTVRYAVQVFSKSVVQSLEKFQHEDCFRGYHISELKKLAAHMNRFFDCCNGKQREGEPDPSNPDLASYRDPNDSRFDYLIKDLLGFFSDWEEDIIQRPGNFTSQQRSRMLISYQSLEALKITVYSFVGAIRFMLQEAKAPSVCGRVFNQDPLEQYFSTVRRKQGDDNNPNLSQALHTSFNIHVQGQAAVPSKSGNTQVEKKSLQVDSTPLQSIQKRK